jgi:hypothetical protein
MIAPLLLAVDFMNFTYAKNPCSQNVPVPAVMTKGWFSYFDGKMGTGFDLHVVTVKKGSLAPGTRQAVVVIACDFPVGGTAEAYAYSDSESSAVLLGAVAGANWGADWGRGPDAIHIRFANRFLYVDACKDDECKSYVVKTFALRNGKLVKVYERTHKPPG